MRGPRKPGGDVDAMGVTITPGSGRNHRGSVSGDRSKGMPGFDEFVAACSTRLLTTAYLLTRDHGRAEDLVQTALTKTWFAWSRINGEPEAYVRQGHGQHLRQLVASQVERRATHRSAFPEHGYDVDTSAGQDLWTALGRLPRGQRAVLVLRYYEDLSEIETARLLECSVGTVKSQSAKGLAKLRKDCALVDDETLDETMKEGEQR